MRMRTLLATSAAGILLAGVTGHPASADTDPSPDTAGLVVAWGDDEDPSAGPAMAVPADLTAPVASIAASGRATAAVTTEGDLRVWGSEGASEVDEAPGDVTDGVSVALGLSNGAVLHADGSVTAWGSPAIAEVPEGLTAKAVAVAAGTGYAVRPDGTLATWGATPMTPVPTGLTDLVDVSANIFHVLALRSDGTVVTWGFSMFYPQLISGTPDLGGRKVTQIATGSSSSGVVLDDGTIEVWGEGTPSGEPELDGETPAEEVVRLGLYTNAVAVTADGAVHSWGSEAAVADVPAALEGQPVADVAVGQRHAAVVVTAFRDLAVPTIAGTPQVGRTLTATPATFSLEPSTPPTGQWYAGEEAIAEATGTSLVLGADLIGEVITYRTSGTRDTETVTSTSAPTAAVAPAASTTTLSVSPAAGAAGAARTVTATVATAGGTPTGPVTFKVGTRTVTRELAGGKASWALPTLAAGRHAVSATYAGDSTTAASTATPLQVQVAKANAKVGVKATVKGSGKKPRTVKLTITVDSSTGISPAGKVTVTLKGATSKKVSAKVSAAGKAVVTVKKLKRGKYTASVAYAGNASVSAAKGKTTFKA